MQAMTVEITDRGAWKILHSLKEKNLIRIVEETDLNSPALPGMPQSLNSFKNWISNAKTGNSISLIRANKRKQL